MPVDGEPEPDDLVEDDLDDDDSDDSDGSDGVDDGLGAILAAVAATPEVHSAGEEDLLLGRRLGRFVITARLGKGGMGVVYRARDPELRRDVALKVLPEAASRDPERRARFLREARAAAGLTHPGIAAIHEVGADDDTQLAWIAMELVDGHDLRQALAGGALPIADVERLGLQIARALARAHAAGIVHRDLKPENIMITSEGDAKILDFGLAKQFQVEGSEETPLVTGGATTREGTIVGTPGYMAPEQVLGRPVDARADVFSFGVVLHELLGGRAPFVGDTPMATALAVTHDAPAPLTRDGVPPRLRDVIASCLEKEPSARPADGRAVVALLDGQVAPSRRPTPPSLPTSPTTTTRETPSLSAAFVAPGTARGGRAGRSRLVAASVGVAIALLAGAVLWRARGPTPDETVRALFLDPEKKLACVPFTVIGDIQSKHLGTAAAQAVCQGLSAWRFSADRFQGPAMLLALPLQGVATFPEDPFFTDEGAALVARAAADRAAVISGDVDVDRAGTRLTLRVRRAGAADGEVLVVQGPRTTGFSGAAVAAVRLMMDRLEVAPATLDDDARGLFGVDDGRALLGLVDLDEHLGRDVSGTCARLASELPLLAGRFAEVCGHPERGLDGVPLWPAGLAQRVEGLSSAARAYWQGEWTSNPETLRALATTLRAARKERTGITASDLAVGEGKMWLKAGNPEAGRTALDVALTLWPGNLDAWVARFPLERDPELAFRTASAWIPQVPVWAHRAHWTKDPATALPMEELSYFLAGRHVDQAPFLGSKMFNLGQFERVRAMASFHLDRDGPDDARVGNFLLALHEWSAGRPGAASDRIRTIIDDSERLDSIALVTVAHGIGVDRLLGREGLEDHVLTRFVLADPPRVATSIDGSHLADLLVAATPAVARRALDVFRRLVDAGALIRGPTTDVVLDGHARLLDGDAAGAAALWRPHAGAFVSVHAVAFERAGETDLAEQRHRVFVQRFAKVPRIQHAQLARLLAARGALDEARPLAEAFVKAWEHTDVPVPAVAEMKAILARAPAP